MMKKEFQEDAMTISLEELKTTAAGLPAAERAELAHHLLRTLDEVDEGPLQSGRPWQRSGWPRSARGKSAAFPQSS